MAVTPRNRLAIGSFPGLPGAGPWDTGRVGAVIVIAVPILFLGAAAGVVGSGLYGWLATWASTLVFAAGAVACAARARAVPFDRPAWTWFAVACGCWTMANLYYAVGVAPAVLPLPSPADLGYFSFPVAIACGLRCYAGSRVGRVSADVALDGLIVGLGIAAVAAAAVFALLDAHPHHLAAILTSLVYPLEDVALLGVMLGIGSVLGWRVNRSGALLAGAIVLITAGDVSLFPRVLGGDDVGGPLSNLCWTAAIACVALAARRDARPPALAAIPNRLAPVVPLGASVLALTILALDSVLGLSLVATLFAVATLLVAFVRLYHSFREVSELADSRRQALTDDLTRLPNRRQLLSELDAVCRERSPHLLALFDLDGFKRFNDTFGHPEGDKLLASLAARLGEAVAPGAVAYRLGGDEFCVLAPASDDASVIIDSARSALQMQAPGWSITASYGTVELPAEADEVSRAMRLVDRRMYVQKERRPASARQQARDVLLSALGEQQPELRTHARDVTSLAGVVAERLGLSPEETEDVNRAAELHDVGKLAIPREILDKPGPLDEAEWEIMRGHTIIGERMLNAAPALRPIAAVVRSSHERWDGDGYPDTLSGEQIPIGARIVAVCDSYDAIVADRPYRHGRPESEAIAELRRGAGSQFDPRVVDAFIAALEAARDEPTPTDRVTPGGLPSAVESLSTQPK